ILFPYTTLFRSPKLVPQQFCEQFHGAVLVTAQLAFADAELRGKFYLADLLDIAKVKHPVIVLGLGVACVLQALNCTDQSPLELDRAWRRIDWMYEAQQWIVPKMVVVI